MQLDFTNKFADINLTQVRGKKIITKTWGNNFGWTKQDALAVIKAHQTYVHNLHDAGITTSTNLDETVALSGGEFVIESNEEYFSQGDVLMQLMAVNTKADFFTAASTAMNLMTTLLLEIPPLRRNHYDSDWLWLSVPLDLKPQNVVYDAGQIILVDTFRPLLWEEDDVEVLGLPSAVPEMRKLPNYEIKTGDIRFQLGRLYGYFIAIATRWYMEQNPDSTIGEIDSIRRELAVIAQTMLEPLLEKSSMFSQDVADILVSDVREIIDESIATGDYEGPQYVQAVYERAG